MMFYVAHVSRTRTTPMLLTATPGHPSLAWYLVFEDLLRYDDHLLIAVFKFVSSPR